MTDTDTIIQPISASKRGDNAYYLGGCHVVGHSPSYAACLHKLDTGDHTCTGAVGMHQCQARLMRDAEELQGKALYYVPRQKLEQGLARVPAWSVPPPNLPRTTTSAPSAAPAPKSPLIDKGGYADAINAAMNSSGMVLDLSAVRPKGEPLAGGASPADINKATQAIAASVTVVKPTLPPATVLHSNTSGAHPRPAPRLAMQPGETPMQYARRCAAAR